MNKILTAFFFAIFLFSEAGAQSSSLIVLGDMHYDLLEDHDMDWLSQKPGDLRQVTEEYTVYTKENWTDFMSVLRDRAEHTLPPVKAVIQLGDLSEGLAGNEEKALQMASNTMGAIEAVRMPVPWILTKGNHDITGPGAADAFQEHYVPMIREQTNNPEINNASYSYGYDNVQITCIDPWDKETDMVAFLEQELSESDAKYKFVAIHEPVIPVTERCWHVLRREAQEREKLLKIIASHKAIVLCGHLHRYSVVRRNTPYGPVVQAMVISVIKERDYQEPTKVITKYGPSLAAYLPDWQPETLEARKAMLVEEANHVTYFKQTDLPGYAIIKIDEKKDRVVLEYYAGFGEEPFDSVDLSRLLEPEAQDHPTEGSALIDPTLTEIENQFLNRQAEAILGQANEVFNNHPPVWPEPGARRSALLLLDGVLHDVYAPLRPPVQQFLKTRISSAVDELEQTEVTDGARIWKLYNHGFVVRTKSVTIGFDLVSRKSAGMEGFFIEDAVMEKLINQCDVLFISHYHSDHAEQWVAQSFINQGKPVVAPPEVWEDKPIYSDVIHLRREPHTLQVLPLSAIQKEIKVVVYPGHQGADIQNNVSLVVTPEGLSFSQMGDQSNADDFEWIDEVGSHHEVDVLMPNCWTTDIVRVADGFDPVLIITGHENEMGHTIDHREPNWLSYHYQRENF
jgi:L-ascorbate metabolism protein UlaG (beta-lactamase superfamily)/UDP-2,3-diacylglucosamine pyrophosphatase LpxH